MSLSVDGRHIVGAAQRVQPLLSLQLGRQVGHRLTVRVIIGRGHEIFRAFRALKAVGEAVRAGVAVTAGGFAAVQPLLGVSSNFIGSPSFSA